ncbi:hypothetical protein VTK26DRAFT_7736 [Humicola hyalothermophila]
MADISHRESFQWIPDETSEPTSTIVLTTPGGRFVDLRILKPLPKPWQQLEHPLITQAPKMPLSCLDWAIAGTSTTTTSDPSANARHASAGAAGPPAPWKWVAHKRWHHWIDSRTPDAASVVDEGDIFESPSSPGLSLETGRMVNPATGQVADYEETWRSEVVVPVPAVRSITLGEQQQQQRLAGSTGAVCVALLWQGDEQAEEDRGTVRRGMVVRVGRLCQGFARDGDRLTAIRLEYDERMRQWIATVRMGDQVMPVEPVARYPTDMVEGETYMVDGEAWKVVEMVG